MNNTVLRRFEYEVQLANETFHYRLAPSPEAAVIMVWADALKEGHVDLQVVSVMQRGAKKELLHATRRQMFAMVKSYIQRIT